MNFQFVILFISTLATSLYCRNSAAATFLSNVTDQQALLSFKTYITGDPLGFLRSWNHSVHFCQWQGVTCSWRHQRVTALDLSSQQLDGTLSPYIGNLSFLRAIYLDKNNFGGSIPGEIGRLFRLQYLHLGSNFFKGEFPMNLSHCSDIREIKLEENNLQGKLPTDFTSWSKLTVFGARTNQFTGSIPTSIGNLTSLRLLDIARNNLTGSIPLEVAYLMKLEHLQLSINNFRGRVPPPLYNVSSLSFVSLTQNELEGRIPEDLGFTLPNLQVFLAGGNKLSGPFPLSITNASKLLSFSIPGNNISGPLPMNFGSLLSLQRLNLGSNQLGHNQPPGSSLSFLGSMVNNTRLEYLELFENGLSGELPNSIGNLSTMLYYLGFSRNYIYGSIPKEIGKLSNLTALSLDENMFTGNLPESICKLSKLGRLFLSYNNISGVIPACISNITGLLFLSSTDNMLQGNIPVTLFNMSSIQELYLSNNRLSGVIPEHILGLSSQCIFLYLDENILTGPLPSNIGSFIHLVDLRVSDNRLTGEIPTSLGDCVMLEELDMNGNMFASKIPSSFKGLKNLIFLDLSNNNLSGNIPHFLGELRLIQFLNLSHNRLEGEVTQKGLFSNASSFSVVGNSQLCGGIRHLQLPACPANISTSKKKKSPLRIIALIILLPLATFLVFFTFVHFRIKKSKQNNVPGLVLQDSQYLRLTYHDLLRATDNFSPNNFLGEGKHGSVYKGILESLQQLVAVKVLKAEVHGADKNFMAECETLRNIRHRNLTKIITTCSSIDSRVYSLLHPAAGCKREYTLDSKGNKFKALVFEFMTNGSLDSWLHPSQSDQGNARNLTLFQRLNIAIDVAVAVDYLHNQSHTKIIHCDIKPSNILLDEEFVARIGDFGLARFFLTNTGKTKQARTSSTGVRGTIGYVPPEYGMGGNVSAEGDVYSYGILLLEMFSGHRPTGSSLAMDHAINLHDYVKHALPHNVMEIADPRIVLQPEDRGSPKDEAVRIELCLASIFEVGILCSLEMPRERVDISVAIKHLNVARDKLLQSGFKL